MEKSSNKRQVKIDNLFQAKTEKVFILYTEKVFILLIILLCAYQLFPPLSPPGAT